MSTTAALASFCRASYNSSHTSKASSLGDQPEVAALSAIGSIVASPSLHGSAVDTRLVTSPLRVFKTCMPDQASFVCLEILICESCWLCKGHPQTLQPAPQMAPLPLSKLATFPLRASHICIPNQAIYACPINHLEPVSA